MAPLTEEQEKQLHFIQNSAVELTEMVNDLLDLAKIEAGRVSISPEWFEMVDLFAALRGMFKPLLTSSDVSLIFEEPTDLPRVYTDHKKLSQILRNYISNALKFTTKGEVRVSGKRYDGEQVIFSVADTGIGIPVKIRWQSSRILCRSILPFSKSGAAAGWDWHSARKLQSCWVAA